MALITFRVQATGALLTDPAITERFDAEIVGWLSELSAIGQRLVVSATPRGVTDGLRGSIVTEMRGTPARRQAAVASSLFYAPIVEVGRRPGKRPPVAALVTWVTRKLGVSPGQAMHVAFLVSRKIGAKGYAGYHMFERAAQQLVPIAQQRAAALEERLRDLLGR
jgi:hypothetical protein